MSASTTSRLQLVKPDPGTSELVNVATQVNASMDKIDAAVGAGANGITSGTRPNPAFANQLIRETDTRRMYVWNPTQSIWDQVLTAGSSFQAQVDVERGLVGEHAFRTAITGDTQYRMLVQAGGQLLWGPGNATQDTNLYRSAANVLKTDDAFDPASIVNENKITPSYQNGWTDWGNPWQGARYWKDKFGIVHLSGLIKGGTSGLAAFTLPAGYRVATNNDLLFTVYSGAGVLGRVDVVAGGQVKVTGTTSLVTLSGISFKAEA